MKIQIEKVNKIFSNDKHNTFTDLIGWKGKFYLAFRTAEDHMSFDGKIVVLCSSDTENWSEVATLSSEGEDNRDPKFLAYGNRLFLYSPIRYDETGNSWKLKTSVGCTDNGYDWTPFKIAKNDYVFWKPKSFGGMHYVVGYTPVDETKKFMWKCELWQAILFKSTDGLSWEEVSIVHQGDAVNETDIEFLPDGKMVALLRLEVPPYYPLLAISEPPYQKWDKVRLDGFILQGPMLRRIKNEFIVVGRSWPDIEKPKWESSQETVIFQLKNNKLVKLATLPSGGDTSYAGSVILPDNKILLSYYSTHETPKSAIYLANIKYEIE